MRLDSGQLEHLLKMFVKEYEACATERTRPYPKTIETLNLLSKLNIPMGVCTNKPEALSRQILEGLGLSGYFASVIGGDTTSARKPDPLPLLTCLEELLAKPASSLMIGDSVHDVHAARAAGVCVAVVPWGYRSAPVDNLGADFVIRDLAALPSLVSGGNATKVQTHH
jgi:phosphoglycolate phosphatase